MRVLKTSTDILAVYEMCLLLHIFVFIKSCTQINKLSQKIFW